MYTHDTAESFPASRDTPRLPVATPDDTEALMRSHFEDGRLAQVANAALEAYGSEIFRFLTSRLRDRSEADEAYAMFSENLWNGLPSFAWRCSMRTWSYKLARNAARRCSAKARQQARYLLPPHSGSLAVMQEELRSPSPYYLNTEVLDRVSALRKQLNDQEQTLLTLRVDRGLAWRDLAIAVMGEADLNETLLERESARLRKSFERVKSELRRMVECEGLLPSND